MNFKTNAYSSNEDISTLFNQIDVILVLKTVKTELK